MRKTNSIRVHECLNLNFHFKLGHSTKKITGSAQNFAFAFLKGPLNIFIANMFGN